MLRVVYGQHGTGPKVRLKDIQVAGKTGTAQVPNRSNDDAWFVAFAPYEQPEIAVAVVVEGGGGGGSVAGPIARQTMEAYFQLVVQVRKKSHSVVLTEAVRKKFSPGGGVFELFNTYLSKLYCFRHLD